MNVQTIEGVTLYFQPKGGMCTACEHLSRDCSDLEFYKMLPVLETDGNTLLVRCSNFVPGK